MKNVISSFLIGMLCTGAFVSCELSGTKLSETKVFVGLGEDLTVDTKNSEQYKDYLLINGEVFLRLSLYSSNKISTLQKLKEDHSNDEVVDEFTHTNGSFGVIYTFSDSDNKRLDAYYKNKDGQWIEIESDLTKVNLEDKEVERAKTLVSSMKSVSKSSKSKKKKKKK
ncbi:MAG: hypothetical protein JKY54_06020 [Flavobacteriales bacterium]|nr:hypothetical protein [Flavobacteriales bacterium]